MNIEAILASGLRLKGDLESIIGVSRVSLYNYRKGINAPNARHKSKLEKLEKAVAVLVAKGVLPPKDKEARKKIVEKLREHVGTR